MSAAEELRAAAALMRERAEAATASPWATWAARKTYIESMAGDVSVLAQMAPLGTDADAAHIASWHPAVALAVADWLDATADHADATGGHCVCDDAALTVARTYLRTP